MQSDIYRSREHWVYTQSLTTNNIEPACIIYFCSFSRCNAHWFTTTSCVVYALLAIPYLVQVSGRIFFPIFAILVCLCECVHFFPFGDHCWDLISFHGLSLIFLATTNQKPYELVTIPSEMPFEESIVFATKLPSVGKWKTKAKIRIGNQKNTIILFTIYIHKFFKLTPSQFSAF